MIEHVLYINLGHRIDRRKSIKSVLSCFKDVHRIEGVVSTYGCLGATHSHIKALEYAIAKNWDHVLIVEDDMVWNKYIPDLAGIKDYDVIVLGGVLVDHDPVSHKLHKCNSVGAYLVSRHYYQTLLNNFKQGRDLLEVELYKPMRFGRDRERQDELYRIDVWWHSLQKDNWYILPMMYSPPGFSDVRNKIIDHSNLFLKE
jgi:hypothetical protein